ncbi:MAG: GNAT family N-acetyltransferase [Myxococcales bacterium]|nr:GNAT family N-acetyltransferase [Myxococcales bacterium]
MTFLVRPIERADVDAAVALVGDTLFEFGLQFGVGSDTDTGLWQLPASYTDHGGQFFVAVAGDGLVVGTAGVFPVEPRVYELRKMYLRPEVRGQHVGAQLFDACVAFCRQKQAQAVVLDTREDMRSAIAFYEKRGFVRDDSQRRGARCHRGYRLDL